MAISKQTPAVKITVGDQYICKNVMDSGNNWTETFESDVIELPTVVNVEVTDNSDSYETYASGAVYDSDTPVTSQDIAEENVAFPTMLLAELRGETVDSDGVTLGGGFGVRPFFAYGMAIKRKDGSWEYRWYPKCKLITNTDKTETSEDSHKDQNEEITIRAYGYNDNGNTYIRCLTSEEGMEDMTAAAFFAAPLLTVADVKGALPTTTTTTTTTTP